MFDLGPKQSRHAWMISLLLYAAVMAGLFAWLAFNGEETTQRRLEKTPSVTIVLAGKETPVPQSWKEAPKEEIEETPAAQTPLAETEKPEEKPTEEKTAEPVVEPQKTEETKTETAPHAATETKVETAPAETTPPVEPQAAEPQAKAAPQPPALRWQRFARPFDQANDKPRISIIIADLGLASAATLVAVQELPGEVSLAFSSSAPDLETWIAKARAAGHEAILTVPMEPENYPQNDPGPNTLLTGLESKENVNRMRWALARSDGYVAVMPYMGGKFITAEDKLAPVLSVVKDEGLMVIDNSQNNNSLIPTLSRLGRIPFARADAVIDLAASRTAIDAQLEELEKIAQTKGHAIGIALPYPVTFEKLKAWIPAAEKKGFVLAPITALASHDVAPAAVETEEAATPAQTVEGGPEAISTPPQKATTAPVDPNRANNEIVQ